MPRIKTFLVLVVLLIFSFSLIGCGLLSSRSAGPEEVSGEGEDLPEWLLLAYLQDNDNDESPLNGENAVDADEVIEPEITETPEETTPATTQQPTTQPATQPATTSPAPAPTQPAALSPMEEMNQRMNEILKEMYADEIAAEKERLEEEAKEEEEETGWKREDPFENW